MKKPASSVAAKPSPASSFKKKFKFSFSIGLLNIFLFLGIVVCSLVLFFELLSGSSLLNRPVKFLRESKVDLSSSDFTLPAIPSADYYLQTINERDIFKPYVPKITKSAAQQGLVQQMSKYKIVGIAWLDLPETASVMILDIQKKKILFLKKGEHFEGITVKTIYTDRAVFSDGSEETTIKL